VLLSSMPSHCLLSFTPLCLPVPPTPIARPAAACRASAVRTTRSSRAGSAWRWGSFWRQISIAAPPHI
jgi:hypothetical protein